MKYIVRPRMEPLKSAVSVARMSLGSRQLLVGRLLLPLAADERPVFDAGHVGWIRPGKEAVRPEVGLRRMNVPASTRSWQRRLFSSAEPSHHERRRRRESRNLIHPSNDWMPRGRPCGSPSTLAPVVVNVVSSLSPGDCRATKRKPLKAQGSGRRTVFLSRVASVFGDGRNCTKPGCGRANGRTRQRRPGST